VSPEEEEEDDGLSTTIVVLLSTLLPLGFLSVIVTIVLASAL
jgi:hypothetical protein